MAYFSEEYCRECGKETPHTNRECDPCGERKRREALAAWQAKTTDEKLLDLHKRLLELERGPITY